MTDNERPVRFCPLCKKADTAPRHAIYGEDANVAKHMVCCRDAGCPDGSCNVLLNGLDNPSEEELITHLTHPDKQQDFTERLAARPTDVREFTNDAPKIILERVEE